jgi:adenylate cyclase
MDIKKKAYYVLIGLFYLIVQASVGQNQRRADSLTKLYNSKEYKTDLEQLYLLGELAFNEIKNGELRLQYANELITLASKTNNSRYLYSGYLQKGNHYNLVGDLDSALQNFIKSAEVAKSLNYIEGEGTAYMSMADVYSIMGNYDNAEDYYTKAINILQQTDKKIALASAYLNLGDSYLSNSLYSEALLNFKKAEQIFEAEDYKIGLAYNKGNVGMVYAELDNHVLAEKNINDAILILEALEDYYPISVYLMYMSDIYISKNDFNSALNYSNKSLELAKKYNLKDQISDANLQLSKLHKSVGNFIEALNYYEDHITYKDSVINLKTFQKNANLKTKLEVSEKQAELDLETQKGKTNRIILFSTAGALFFIGLFAIGLFRRNKFVKATNKIISTEKDRSDTLLLNILPEETAQELKDNGKVEAKKFDSVTVLFSDFKGFTQYAENLAPEELVNTIDYYFSKFDEIVEKHGLEKIKTIGDAYMVAGGLPFKTDNHAQQMTKAAFEMAEFVAKAKADEFTEHPFDIRIGINTGPVVAGVVGRRKFAYDIWGDAVNIASRMESNSEPGRINISDNTYQLIKNDFKCDYRGKVAVKNRGQLKMYFVNC